MPPSVVRDLGPCCAEWDVAGSAPVDLHPIHGRAYFTSEDQAVDIFEDGQGVTPVDAVFTGRLVAVEIPMTRAALARLTAAIPGSSIVGNTLRVSNRVGQAMFANSKQVRIRPMEDNVCSTTITEYINFWRAFPMHAFDVGFDLEGQRIFLVRFKIFPDDTSGRVGELWRIGG